MPKFFRPFFSMLEGYDAVLNFPQQRALLLNGEEIYILTADVIVMVCMLKRPKKLGHDPTFGCHILATYRKNFFFSKFFLGILQKMDPILVLGFGLLSISIKKKKNIANIY